VECDAGRSPFSHTGHELRRLLRHPNEGENIHSASDRNPLATRQRHAEGMDLLVSLAFRPAIWHECLSTLAVLKTRLHNWDEVHVDEFSQSRRWLPVTDADFAFCEFRLPRRLDLLGDAEVSHALDYGSLAR
jgi:2-polyprenyl-6-methoxyphenol hydroxylase-like FAD-dependent oxidoreductase